MSGYSFLLGFIAIILCAIIWLPLTYAFDLLIIAINSGVSDPDVIVRNDVMGQLVYYSLFFVILAIILYIIKTKKGEEGAVYVTS